MMKENNNNKNEVLQVQGLTKKFGELVAINDVNFNVLEGEILGIIGPNGSGKTTLFNLMSGVLQPDTGKIRARRLKRANNPFSIIKNIIRKPIDESEEFGENIIGKRPDQIVDQFGLARTFQIVRPFKLMTAQDNAAVPHIPNKIFAKPSTIKGSAVASLLEVDLGEKKNYPALILPHGDLKRLDFARTIATSSKIILLDEPFSGLSGEDSFRVTQLIKNANEDHNVTILIVEHKLRLLANLVSRIIVLDQGKVIADGTPKEISQDKDVIASYLGEEASQIVGS